MHQDPVLELSKQLGASRLELAILCLVSGDHSVVRSAGVNLEDEVFFREAGKLEVQVALLKTGKRPILGDNKSSLLRFETPKSR